MSKDVDQQILQLYEIKKLLGSGAYGHVWKVLDRQNRKQLALKKIFDAFHNDVDAQRTYREITVLHQLDHFNIIKLHRVIKAKNNKDLYLVFDFMQSDLQSLVGSEILEDVHTRYVIYQILRALKYLHSAQLIHRDLKPSNILINSECEVKICDFGLVRSLTHEEDQQMILSQQVATRWYRSPEMLLGSKKYGKQTDVWSVGCIIAELLMGEAIFPGDSTLNQLQRIIQFTGVPSKHNMDSIQSQVAQSLINQLNIHRKSFRDQFKKFNKDLVFLITRMLQFNPKSRITVEQALQLDLFAEFRTHKSHEDICTKFIVPQLDDNLRLPVQSYRKMIYCDIQRRYPDLSNQSYYSLDKSMQKQNKENKENQRILRSHHSLNRKKSSQHLRVLNSSVHGIHSIKKQASSSFHQGDCLDRIKKMKKEWKKPALMNAQSYNSTQSHTQNQSLGQVQSSNYSNKVESFYKSSSKGALHKDSTNILTKVRSRKILYKSKSRQKLQHPKTIHVQKRRIIR